MRDQCLTKALVALGELQVTAVDGDDYYDLDRGLAEAVRASYAPDTHLGDPVDVQDVVLSFAGSALELKLCSIALYAGMMQAFDRVVVAAQRVSA